MSKRPVLIVMAAGLGSRFGGLKQITPVGDRDEIIMDFSLYDAMVAGFRDAIFIIKKEHEADFREKLDAGAGKYLNIKYVFQELSDIPDNFRVPDGRERPWGTGQAVLTARSLVDGPFAVINADDFYGREAFKKMFSFLSDISKAREGEETSDGHRYAMVAYRLEKTLSENGTVSRGVCQVSGGDTLLSITERTKICRKDGKICYRDEDDPNSWHVLSPSTPVSMNFWGFTPSMMEELESRFPAFLTRAIKNDPLEGEYFLPGVVGDLLSEDLAEVTVLDSPDQWFGVTYTEDVDSVTKAIKELKEKEVYPSLLWT